MSAVLEISNVTRRFAGLVAVNDVSFTLNQGEILGVIGPTRLNYARIIPMVDYTAKVVSKVLGG